MKVRQITNLDSLLRVLVILAPLLDELVDYIEGYRSTPPSILATLPETLRSEVELARAQRRAKGGDRR